MTAFFICIILIGVLMIGLAMIWMVIERKNARDYRLELDERRFELQHIIEDADALLNELNRFSDYIVNRMEEKQQDMETMIQHADERLDLFNQVNETAMQAPMIEDIKAPVVEELELKQEIVPDFVSNRKGKIISFDIKRREVEKLRGKGMDNTAIARLLNMGKGEIDLITKMCR